MLHDETAQKKTINNVLMAQKRRMKDWLNPMTLETD